MDLATLTRRFGNELYKFAFPIYRPLYGLFKSYADRAERELLARHLFGGAVVVDASANIGTYSRFLAQCVGPSGVVHSFEPDADNFKRLSRALAHWPNVRLNHFAVGDQTGESFLYISDDLNVDHRAYPSAGEDRRKVPMHVVRLDDYFPPGKRVDLIKMDIQGFELRALRGAERVLEENRRLKMVLEFWPYGLRQAGTSGPELVSFLRERDFSLSLIADWGIIHWDSAMANDCDPSNYTNLFAERGTGES